MASPIISWINTLPAAWRLQDYSLTSNFFWIVVLATTFGLLLSFTSAPSLEGAGASTIGSAMWYLLLAAIGMHMGLGALVD